jgi:hypothetical protein
MAIRNSWETGNKTFSVQNLISEIEEEISTVMFISGMDGSLIDNYELDEILAELKKSFPIIKQEIDLWRSIFPGFDGDIHMKIIYTIQPAYEFYINKNFNKLSLIAKRNKRWLKIAKYIEENQNG